MSVTNKRISTSSRTSGIELGAQKVLMQGLRAVCHPVAISAENLVSFVFLKWTLPLACLLHLWCVCLFTNLSVFSFVSLADENLVLATWQHCRHDSLSVRRTFLLSSLVRPPTIVELVPAVQFECPASCCRTSSFEPHCSWSSRGEFVAGSRTADRHKTVVSEWETYRYLLVS